MKGFEIIFIAPRARLHDGRPVLDAVADLARIQGITRMARRETTQGVAADGHGHSAHFFELTDEPQELMFVLDGGEADKLLRAVEDSGVKVFCVRRQIDYWPLGETD